MSLPLPSTGATIEVGAAPLEAFAAFTEEMDSWWARGPANMYDGARALERRFDGDPPHRWIETYIDGELEIATVTEWDPGHRIALLSSLDDTETEVTFDGLDEGGTLVRIEQRVLPDERHGRAHLLIGWPNILNWFARWVDRSTTMPPVVRELPRLTSVLFYEDVRGAADWLVRVYGLRSRGVLPADPSTEALIGEVELVDSVVILLPADDAEVDGGAAADRPARHMVWAYVDDLDAHIEHARAAGAVIVHEVTQHGDRTYVTEDLEGHRWTFAQARPTQRA